MGIRGLTHSACFCYWRERPWSGKKTLLQGNPAVDAEVRMHIESLRKLTTKQLKERFREVCGEESLSSNHTHLFRRVAWQLQANVSGGLNGRVLERASHLALEVDRELPLPQSFREASQ